jgi:hypothetical protein
MGKNAGLTTMRVHGHRLPLATVARSIRVNGYKQADVARRIGVHQTAVSHYLTGKVPATGHFRQFVEALISAEQAGRWAAQAAPQPTPQPQPQPQQTPVGPPPPYTPQPAPEPTPATPAPNATATPAKDGGPLSVPFRARQALQVINLARKAQADGHISYPSGIRKLINWGRAYYLLRSVGFTADDAHVGAYDVVIRSKTEPGSEDRRFAEESFYTVFGLMATACKIPVGAPADQHPGYTLAMPFVKAGLPVWFYGVAGTGKTHTAEVIAEEVAGDYYTVQCTRDMTKDDFVGSLGAQGGSTVKHYGPLALAMQEGVPLILEEPSVAPAEILMVLQQVLTGKPLLITGMGAVEKVTAKEGGNFTIIANDNTVGLGEGIDYVGTGRMNEAFRDRFYFVEYGHMADDMTLLILSKHIETFKAEQGWA